MSSMTKEEAATMIETMISWYAFNGREAEALGMGVYALRPVSRERVEQVWRGEWIIRKGEHSEFIKKCSKCGFPISGWWGADKFCANCGAPMTDEAVEMVMKRMEALYEDNGCS